MQLPKILPWLARRAGIDDTLAAKLWRRAAGEAAVIAGNRRSSDFFRLAIERLISLIEAESGHSQAIGGAFAWLWPYQARIANLGFIATVSVGRAWQQGWRALLPCRRGVAFDA